MAKKIIIIVGAVVFFFVALIAAAFILQPDQSQNTIIEKPDPKPDVSWDGKSERIYATEIAVRKSRDKLIIQKAAFADLDTASARVRIDFLYLGPRVFNVQKNIAGLYGGTKDKAKKKVSLSKTKNDETLFSVRFLDVPIYSLEKNSEVPLWLVIEKIQKDPLYINVSATPDPGYTLGGEEGTAESQAEMKEKQQKSKDKKKKEAQKKKKKQKRG